ncbi:YceD family protein [Rugosibacter aromaticivorans]|uniref:YceD family protein n=1 Tax=Rugosibacter aromaticivorans TaxID=1565605 RepID=UPI00192A1803|nr:YceD family protein [Rugosibacter aromaticivorans]
MEPIKSVLSLTTVNSLEFARGSRFVEGAVPLTWLPHLANQLLERNGSLAVSLEGWQSERKSLVRLVIDGTLVLQCQRCLASVRVPMQVNSVLQLISAGEDWPDEALMDDQMDAIDASEELDVVGLIENEVLLALPFAPRHEHCELPKATGNEYGSASFLALAALKKR